MQPVSSTYFGVVSVRSGMTVKAVPAKSGMADSPSPRPRSGEKHRVSGTDVPTNLHLH